MSKVLVIPDSHLKIDVIEHGLELAKAYRADHIVMLGDYFDDWDATDDQYHQMIDYLKKLLVSNPNVIPLLGNHELSYMGYPCAGHNHRVAEELGRWLIKDRRFYFGVGIDSIFYSHAGVCNEWLRNNKVVTENEFRYTLCRGKGAVFLEEKMSKISSIDVFAQASPSRGGSSSSPSPLWSDIEDLMNDQLNYTRQVVGHTPVTEIQCLGKCWFTDVFSNGNVSDEYLMVVDDEPIILHYNDFKQGITSVIKDNWL